MLAAHAQEAELVNELVVLLFVALFSFRSFVILELHRIVRMILLAAIVWHNATVGTTMNPSIIFWPTALESLRLVTLVWSRPRLVFTVDL